MHIGFGICAVHRDAVQLIRSVALIHPTGVRSLEAAIAIRDGAADDDGLRYIGMLP
jgi:hypothetical protein